MGLSGCIGANARGRSGSAAGPAGGRKGGGGGYGLRKGERRAESLFRELLWLL